LGVGIRQKDVIDFGWVVDSCVDPLWMLMMLYQAEIVAWSCLNTSHMLVVISAATSWSRKFYSLSEFRLAGSIAMSDVGQTVLSGGEYSKDIFQYLYHYATTRSRVIFPPSQFATQAEPARRERGD
jgi:hypothetical protein